MFIIVTNIVDAGYSRPIMLVVCYYPSVTVGAETVIMHKKYGKQYLINKKV